MAPKKSVSVSSKKPKTKKKESESELEQDSYYSSGGEDSGSGSEVETGSGSGSESGSGSGSDDQQEINTMKRYTCDLPCGSILVYSTDKHKNLILRCTSCQQKYKSNDIIISEIKEGEETSNTLDYQRIVNNITIKVVDYDCKTCKKKTLAKYWREKSTYISNYLCMTCQQFYTSLS